MVGIVIVSHSHRIAEGVAELAREMGGPDVRLETAGGLDMPDHPIGTDAVLVMAAIDRAWSDDGVLVLMDLGSAVLSAEMAIDLMPEDRRSGVLLCEAPIVEGAVAAAVTAKLGASARARRAGSPRRTRREDGAPRRHRTPSRRRSRRRRRGSRRARSRSTVNNPHGLHARPAARFVQTASSFDAARHGRDLTNGRGPADAASLNAVAMLGATQGHAIQVAAAGPQAPRRWRRSGARRARLRRSSRAPRTWSAALRAPRSSRTRPASSRAIPRLAGDRVGPATAVPNARSRRARRSRAAPTVEVARSSALDAVRERHRPPARASSRDERAATRRRSSTRTCSSCATTRSWFRARRSIVEDGVSAARAWRDDDRAHGEELGRPRGRVPAGAGRRPAERRAPGARAAPGCARSRIPSSRPGRGGRERSVAGRHRGARPGHASSGSPRPAADRRRTRRCSRARRGIPAVVGAGERLLRSAEGTPVVVDGTTGAIACDPDPSLLAELDRRARRTGGRPPRGTGLRAPAGSHDRRNDDRGRGEHRLAGRGGPGRRGRRRRGRAASERSSCS